MAGRRAATARRGRSVSTRHAHRQARLPVVATAHDLPCRRRSRVVQAIVRLVDSSTARRRGRRDRDRASSGQSESPVSTSHTRHRRKHPDSPDAPFPRSLRPSLSRYGRQAGLRSRNLNRGGQTSHRSSPRRSSGTRRRRLSRGRCSIRYCSHGRLAAHQHNLHIEPLSLLLTRLASRYNDTP